MKKFSFFDLLITIKMRIFAHDDSFCITKSKYDYERIERDKDREKPAGSIRR